MSLMLTLVFSQVGFAATGLLLAVLSALGRGRGRMARALGLLIGAYTVASLYCVPYGASQILATGYGPLPVQPRQPGRTAIVTLGTGEWAVRGWDGRPFTLYNPRGIARVLEARRVFDSFDDAWIITSGGPTTAEPGAPTSAGAMRAALVELGVPAGRILLEEASYSTREEVLAIAPILRELAPSRVVLVTSDFHMRRALGAFRAAGIAAAPSIARDPFMRFSWRFWALPSGDGLRFSGAVVHELVGTAYYAGRGWWR